MKILVVQETDWITENDGFETINLDAVLMTGKNIRCNSKKTLIDNLSTILFNSECMAKLVMDSPLKPKIYGVATKLRNKDEQCVNDQLKRGHE